MINFLGGIAITALAIIGLQILDIGNDIKEVLKELKKYNEDH